MAVSYLMKQGYDAVQVDGGIAKLQELKMKGIVEG